MTLQNDDREYGVDVERELATLPHETSEGPADVRDWQLLLETAPRGTDSVGRPTIQVCTADDGHAIFATVEYAVWQADR